MASVADACHQGMQRGRAEFQEKECAHSRGTHEQDVEAVHLREQERLSELRREEVEHAIALRLHEHEQILACHREEPALYTRLVTETESQLAEQQEARGQE